VWRTASDASANRAFFPGSDWRRQWQRALLLMVVTSKAMSCTLQASQSSDREFGLRWWRLMAHLFLAKTDWGGTEARCPIKTSALYPERRQSFINRSAELLAFFPYFFPPTGFVFLVFDRATHAN